LMAHKRDQVMSVIARLFLIKYIDSNYDVFETVGLAMTTLSVTMSFYQSVVPLLKNINPADKL